MTFPPGVVTLTFTDPVPCGTTAVIVVEFTTVKLVAAVLPKLTAVAPVKFVPVSVTVAPTIAEEGLKLEAVGAEIYVNALFCVAVPPPVVTLTFTAPADPAGATAVI